MKKIITTALVAVTAAGAWGATLDVRGVEYSVDTVFHAKVGPGTTQTSLRLRAASNPLNVHYLTVDKRVPGVSLRAVCANDKVAGVARTSAMAESKSRDGLDYFCGVNADFFATSGSATNGSSKVGTPTTSCIVDGEIYKSSTANYQFVADADGHAEITRLNYYTGTATIGDKVTLFKGVNVMSPNNGITVYTPRFWGSANQNDYAGSCNQVTAVLVDGDSFTAGGKFRLKVTSNPTTDGDLAVPAGGYVIHGRGTSTTGCNTGAKGFVGALREGDIVEFDNIILSSDGRKLTPLNVVSGNPQNVGQGLTLDTEAERGDAKDRHPRTCIGVSQTGDSIIMMVIEGRSTNSVGVSTSMLADVMRYAGAYQAVNLDGGGSSTLYTRALGVRNYCSDGNERAVGNAIFAVLEAPEDNTVAEIAFADWAKNIPLLGQYTPVIYGYNKYGKLIDTDYRDFILEATGDWGTVNQDGKTVISDREGTYILTATGNGGMTATITVKVTANAPVQATLENVLLNATRQWDVQLHSIVDGAPMQVSPAAFQWSSADASVAQVTPAGTVQGVADGSCVITGVRGDTEIPVNVTVEVPRATFHHIDPVADTQAWSTSVTSAKVTSFTANPDHTYTIDYTQTSTRGPKVAMAQKIALWSHPQAVKVEVDASQAAVGSAVLTVRAANNTRTANATVDATDDGVYSFDLGQIVDLDDVAVYPIEFTSLAFNLTGKASVPYTLKVNALQTQYDESTVGAVTDMTMDTALPFVKAQGLTLVFAPEVEYATVTDMAGRTVTCGKNCLTVPAHGIYVVSACTSGCLNVCKIKL